MTHDGGDWRSEEARTPLWRAIEAAIRTQGHYKSYSPQVAKMTRAVIRATRRVADDAPGTPLAIINAMGAYAEKLGHPPTSARHPLSFLISHIEHQADIITAANDVLGGIQWPSLNAPDADPDTRDRVLRAIQILGGDLTARLDTPTES